MFLNDWKKDGFFQMVADFSDCYISKDEFESEEFTYQNSEYMTDQKERMAKELSGDKWKGVEIILASYSYQDYSGDAFVLFKKDGKLFEVNGSHCSCYGLEGQWEPEETTLDSLTHRLENGVLGSSYCGNEFKNELAEILKKMKDEE